jgi:hypothetical protein
VKTELKKVRQLFTAFDKGAVRYCHWKSNQHLGAALAGETDLDILVDNAQAGLCRQILQECGCKQVVTQPGSSYGGIEDWLAFDADTGSLAHLHLHFKLIAGGRPKNYHLPLENWLLTDCGSLQCLAIPAHEKELIVLIVRTAFKTKYLDLLRACLLPAYEFIPRAIRVELDWLLERVNIRDVSDCLGASGLSLDGSLVIDFLERYASGRMTPAFFFAFKGKLARCLSEYALQSPVRFHAARALLCIKSFLLRPQEKKTLHRGVYFALVGADGSGKTRLAHDLAAWLGWKLEARRLYFGIPKTSRTYAFLSKAIDISSRLQGRLPGSMSRPVAGLLPSMLWVYVARHRFGLSRQAAKAQAQGCVVIAERFPLRQFWEMAEPMDGPRLQGDSRKKIFAFIENLCYNRITMPGSLFVLKASADELHARKPVTPVATLGLKADAVNALTADDKTIVMDAEAPYENVLHAIKTQVWEML